ncbi:alpha/beta fold hydrolase [Microbacterium halophytorum]|uniref:alpha/beta fold hydrolase n=1 Tax=Microbacterium halophytorum TaxID=2067568 RepID=UPI0018E07551|nr:alpha/beta hydrolase [Microbacterium halophytorum]
MTRPIVLVHGAWGGAWVWRRVLGPLRDAGHEVHAVTLTGDGERAHLRRPDITLGTHIDDVVGLVEAEELDDVVLVGHSYGGMVITGAAAALRSAEPSRVGGLAYVDAMVPLPGEGWGVRHSPAIAAARRAAAAEHGNALPPPDPAEGFALDEADAAWLRRRHVPHPFGMYQEPLEYDAALLDPLPRLFVDCSEPAYRTIDSIRERVRSTPGWRVEEIRTGHFPMVTEPEALVRHLVAFAEGTGSGD